MLRAFLEREREALFLALYEAHHARLYAIAYRILCHTEDAEDALQDSFAKVYAHLAHFRGLPPHEQEALLVIYTKHTAIDCLRRRRRQGRIVPLEYEDEDGNAAVYAIPDPAPQPEEIVVAKETAQHVAKLIEGLPDGQRDVILLKYRYHMKAKEIARVLGISRGAVEARVDRAKRTLKERLRGKYDV